MRVLFDQNVPDKLRRHLFGHQGQTADEMGWALLANGALLAAAETAGFAIMVTCDQNIAYQQNLKNRRLALVVLTTNNWAAIRENTAPVRQAVDAARPGSFQVVPVSAPPRGPRGPSFAP